MKKRLDVNCNDVDYFVIDFQDDNYDGLIKDQEMFTRWLRDLRSGKYTQLRGELFSEQSETSYCSLGILCKKFIRRLRQNSSIDNSDLNDGDIVNEIIEHRNDYFNDIIVYTDSGFKFDIVSFIFELNDQCKLSFNIIADIMEAIHLCIRGEDNTKLLSTLSKNNNWELQAI